MTDDLEQPPATPEAGPEVAQPLPTRVPTRSGRHRAPDDELELDESHLVAIVTHLSTIE